ncbi:ATP-binding cassette domain-containing protein [Leuconostoc lactis]|uniref:ATP-binding cassette domain-containing protein n=1 Tax=Leuconostoc lactis TaxID=1246 RepID=UPI00020DA0A8|nr:ATP-binding cassette domain-containing protein [Leuconostoc lactis]
MKINDLTLPRDLLHEQTVCWPDQGITVMLGQNGVGKSTLLAELARRLPEAAYLPQKNDIYDDISVQAVLALGQQRATQPTCLDVVAAFDLASLLKTAMRTLSGGQQQRVWLAFMLVQQAPILLLDEPLAALDLRYQNG